MDRPTGRNLVDEFDDGRDGKTAHARLKGKSAKVQGLSFAEGILWKRRLPGGPFGQLTFMRVYGVYLGIQATTGEVIAGIGRGVWLTRTVWRKTTKRKMDTQQSGDDRCGSVHVVAQGDGEASARRKLPMADLSGFEGHCEGGSSTKALEGTSGQAAVATQQEQAAPGKAIDPAGWTTRGRQVVNIEKTRTGRRKVDEDGGN